MDNPPPESEPPAGAPAELPDERIVAYRWNNGELETLDPEADWAKQGKSALWVDAAGLNGALFAEQVGDRVPGIPPAALYLADIGTPPDDPSTARALGDRYDARFAARMAQGQGVLRFITGEPVFVVIRGAGPDREWSSVLCVVRMLAAPGVLVTLRQRPMDLRWGSAHGLGVTPREFLTTAATTGAMPGRPSSFALGTLLLVGSPIGMSRSRVRFAGRSATAPSTTTAT